MAKVDMKSGDIHQPIVTVDLPGNSILEKSKEPPKAKKVVSGKVVTKKEGLSKKFKTAFFGEDVVDVKSYILFDVIIPGIKNVLFSTITDGFSMLFWQDVRRGGDPRDGRYGSRVSYDRYYRDKRDYQNPRNRQSSTPQWSEIILESRAEAQHVLNTMVDYIEQYGQVRVSDLYDMVGITDSFTDNYWGWTNLSRADVRPVREGFLLDLPRPISLR